MASALVAALSLAELGFPVFPCGYNKRPALANGHGFHDATTDPARITAWWRRCPNANIEVAGHTDTDGEEAANQALSEKRAQAVTDYLARAGLPASRFTPVGYGSTQPVAGNDSDEGKAQNRRIDFVVRQ